MLTKEKLKTISPHTPIHKWDLGKLSMLSKIFVVFFFFNICFKLLLAMVNCYVSLMFSQPKDCSHFSYMRSMECVFQRGNTGMLKQENLNVMCTFSSHMDNVFVLINGIFKFISYAVNFMARAWGPAYPSISWLI